MPQSHDPNRPDFESPARRAMRARWEFVRRMRGGTDALREHAATLLPRFPAESRDNWDARVRMTVVFDAVQQAVSSLVGVGLAQGITLTDDVPPQLVELWENADGLGNHGEVFSANVLDNAMTDGHAGILVDYPPEKADGQPRTAADDAQRRPRMILIPAADIMEPRVEVVDGIPVLVQVRLRFESEEADGAFGLQTVVRYLVYDRVAGTDGPVIVVRVFREILDAGASRFEMEGEPRVLRNVRQIPLAAVYGGQQEGVLVSRPPLMGLAHSQHLLAFIESDRRTSEHKTGVVTLVRIGAPGVSPHEDGPPVPLGENSVIDVPIGGDAKWLESSGSGLTSLADHARDVEKHMGQQALSLLQPDARTSETATAHRLTHQREESTVARALRSLQDAEELVLQWEAQFMGLGDDGGSVQINTDMAAILGIETLRLLSDMEERGQLTLESLIRVTNTALRLGVDPVSEANQIRRLGEDPPMDNVPA